MGNMSARWCREGNNFQAQQELLREAGGAGGAGPGGLISEIRGYQMPE